MIRIMFCRGCCRIDSDTCQTPRLKSAVESPTIRRHYSGTRIQQEIEGWGEDTRRLIILSTMVKLGDGIGVLHVMDVPDVCQFRERVMSQR